VNFQEFVQSLEQGRPPKTTKALLVALWQDAKGNWSEAHSIVQEVDDSMACWIHAYLHRKEGDLGNAGYWYSRAGKTRPDVDLKSEWEELVRELT
jgi:hypothetical protein